MAHYEFKLPDIGEGVAEGEIVAWHVAKGDSVHEDQPMVEVMTDKATVTIGAPKAGVIMETRFAVGSVARVGDVLVVIGIEGDAADTPKPSESKTNPSADRVASAVGDIREGLPGSNFFARASREKNGRNGAGVSTDVATLGGGASAYFRAKPLATPATRKLARDLGLDLRRVAPTGKDGRVTNEDVRAHATGAAEMSVSTPSRAAVPTSPGDQRVPFIGMRRRIAEKMQRSKHTAAHFTFVEECDVSRLLELRTRLAPAAERAGIKLSFLPFIVKAVVGALKKHPKLNSMLDEQSNELVLRRQYHIGIATATEQGLMVPVLRDADQRSTMEIAKEIERLSREARAGTLSVNELSGSTFTITSLGKLGGFLATPILNAPEVGILGVHRIKEKPVVRDGQIVIGNVMMLSLSLDHRIVDGHEGAAFAYDVIGYLEDPGLLLLDMQ